MKAEFFDIFGFLGFIFITSVSFWSLYTKNNFPQGIKIILLVIGIIGLIIDGTIVYTTYLK